MDRPSRRRSVAAFMVLLGGAVLSCTPAPDEPIHALSLNLTLSDSNFRVGDVITLTLSAYNGGTGAEQVTMSECPPFFRVTDATPVVVAPPQSPCSAPDPGPVRLEPGQKLVRTYTWNGDSRISPGQKVLPGEYSIYGYLVDERGSAPGTKPILVVIEPAAPGSVQRTGTRPAKSLTGAGR